MTERFARPIATYRSPYRALVSACAIVGLSSVQLDAHAQATDRKAAAEALFEQGRELSLQKNFAAACPKFAASLSLEPGIGTMLWLADCYENNGQTASAWAEFKEAASGAAIEHDPREKVARRRADDLTPRLSRLTIMPPPERSGAGVEIRRDGVVISAAELGVALPVDPGIHALAAEAPDRKPWSAMVQIPSAPGDVTITVPVLEHLPKGSPPAGSSAPPAADIATEARNADVAPASKDGVQRAVGLVTTGVGVVGLGIGAFLGLRAKSTYDNSNSSGHCLADNQCDATGTQSRTDARALAGEATAAVILGAAAAVGGIFIYITAPRAAPKAAVSLEPRIGPRGAAFVVSHAF